MNPIGIIEKYYDPKSELFRILIIHSSQVRDKALDVIGKHPEFAADAQFVSEAAMLHDIGIFLTDAPKIKCFGTHAYVEHGYLGANIVRKEGYEKHALVCERHTGLGLTVEQIVKQNLPVPHREMVPLSIEEKIICYADKFFSKSNLKKELKVKKILKNLKKYDPSHGSLFLEWHEKFK
ncbi:MAG: HDIG domain-containing protein [Bacteroidales bacterium]|nr:HDIG domain-containing protein [Bacteroidales bacterium]